MKASGKSNGNPPKPKSNSSWGSQLVKGFTIDKKTKQQPLVSTKKPSLACPEVSSQKIQYMPYHSRVKRSLIGEFPCSPNAAQVHPHVFDCHRINSPASHDLFNELDHLRNLLRESKDRELSLHSELLKYKESPRVSELENELDRKKKEIETLNCTIVSLECEKTNLLEQVASLSSLVDHREENSRSEQSEIQTSKRTAKGRASNRSLEMEVVELRRLNKELQLQKRNLAFRLSSSESQLTALANVTESDIVAKAQAEASLLRHTNEDLCKQVEGLQMNRLNEVEEIAYLRWMNSCLRQELSNSEKQSRESVESGDHLSVSCKNADGNSERSIGYQNITCYPSKSFTSEICNAKKVSLLKKQAKWPQTDEDNKILECHGFLDKDWTEVQEERSPRRRHSISVSKGSSEDLALNKRRQSDGFIFSKGIDNEIYGTINCCAINDKNHVNAQSDDIDMVQSSRFSINKPEPCKITFDVEKRALRIPNPPPRPSTSVSVVAKTNGSIPVPPPPPPPPPKLSTKSTGLMKRAPQVAELYHSLMKRDSRRDSSGGGGCDIPNVANVRSSMIGEIENRSSHLLAIKADVETQGEFVKSLIKEVNDAAYRDINDVVAFVKWLDDELCFLVDERAVLKHFDWPEKKADTLREAAFGYRDLKKLESEVTNYEDDPRLPSDVTLKKMVALSEKMELSIYSLLRTRDVMIRNCKEFQIPTDWMLDNGIISKIKFASVKLAKKYMKRVAAELQAMGASDKDPALEYMLLQGVRFAFRIHQFAGGFDAETMHAFEELQNLAHIRDDK